MASDQHHQAQPSTLHHQAPEEEEYAEEEEEEEEVVPAGNPGTMPDDTPRFEALQVCVKTPCPST